MAVVFLVVQPVHGFQSWFLDVGQGDGVFLRTRDEAILSDCGSSQDKKIGKNVLGPFLKSQGIRTLDWILVSHADADHTNGIEWLLKEEADIRVRNLALPAAGKGQRHDRVRGKVLGAGQADLQAGGSAVGKSLQGTGRHFWNRKCRKKTWW